MFVLKLAIFGLSVRPKALGRVRHCLIALSIIRLYIFIKFIPDSLHTLTQLIDIVDLYFVHLNYRPDYYPPD